MFVTAIDVTPIDHSPERTEWRFKHDYEEAEEHSDPKGPAGGAGGPR